MIFVYDNITTSISSQSIAFAKGKDIPYTSSLSPLGLACRLYAYEYVCEILYPFPFCSDW
jgi:hypothetical protein